MSSRLAWIALALVAGCAAEKADGRPWVHDVRIRGLRDVDVSDLRGKIAVEKTSWIPFARKHYLEPLALDQDRDRIEAWLRDRGYFSARVVAAEAKPRKAGSVDVEFTVEQGAPTRIRALSVHGLETFADAARFLRRMKLKAGQVFDHATYDAEKQSIEAALRARGRAWAKVAGEIDVDAAAHVADVQLTIEPGPPATFGAAEIRGTTSINPTAVARRAGLREGEPFDPKALERARRRLYDLGLFSTVNVAIERDPARPDVARPIVTVEEARKNELKLGVGFGLEPQRTDVHGQLLYTRRNFLGGMRTLRLRVEPAWVATPAFWSLQRQGPGGTVELHLLQPDRPWPLGMIQATLAYDLGIDYAYQYHGPRGSLGFAQWLWNDQIRLGLSYNVEALFFFNTDPAILSNPVDAGRVFGYVDPYRLTWWQQEASLDLRDQPLDARRGVYFGVVAEEGGTYSGSDFEYEKVQPEARGYLPLGDRVVLAGRLAFGQMFSQGALGTPVTRRLYLGGPNSHRGFTFNRLAPQVPSGSANVSPLPIGGDQMVLATAELRSELFKIAGYWLSAVVFVDAGDVSAPACPPGKCAQLAGTPDHVDLANLHYATGGGLRYKTVLGTLRADLGVRLNRLSPAESNGAPNPDPGQRLAFHFSVGEAF